ncbi:MAG: hypothetical protein AAGE86_12805, partial [Pseudomonadota bacterium]
MGRESLVHTATGLAAFGDTSAPHVQIALPGATAAVGDADMATFQRLAAALETPLAGLQSGAQSGFTVNVTGANGPMSAQVQLGVDGKLTVV